MNKKNQIQPDRYKISLDLDDKIYKAEGSTMLKAVNRLKKPDKIKTLGLLRVEYGKKKIERRYNIIQIKRLFAKEFIREIAAKNLSILLR